ncbi:hypothetical protein, partial [Nonomuraea cypriaca]|uniref:hypothetical protein n=1 Tax=Nonomuraea cypriaca TaxID=1187855 RepID=UPI001A9C557B
PFPEVVGIIVHGINSGLVIPVLALVLLILSFFARISGARHRGDHPGAVTTGHRSPWLPTRGIE